MIAIDAIPERLAMAEAAGCETINFKEHKDIVKRILELVPSGLDVGLDCGKRFSTMKFE